MIDNFKLCILQLALSIRIKIIFLVPHIQNISLYVCVVYKCEFVYVCVCVCLVLSMKVVIHVIFVILCILLYVYEYIFCLSIIQRHT